jgi:hypothetical protein
VSYQRNRASLLAFLRLAENVGIFTETQLAVYAAEKIEIRAEGKDSQLDEQRVEELQSQNTQQPQQWMTGRKKATWLAYNRRVDIILEPAGQESTEAYPNDTPDAHFL